MSFFCTLLFLPKRIKYIGYTLLNINQSESNTKRKQIRFKLNETITLERSMLYEKKLMFEI